MVMEPISVEEAQRLAARSGLKPVRDIKTGKISLLRTVQSGFQLVSWSELETELTEQGLALYRSNGTLSIRQA